MFFRKRRKGRDPEEEAALKASSETGGVAGTSAGKSHEDEGHLDFVAELIRIYGEGAFAVGARQAEDTQSLFEAWARHLLVGVPAPRDGKPSDEESSAVDDPRDLPGLRRAFRDHRESENEYVSRSLGDFREATWAFISGLRRSLTAEQSADEQLAHRMRRLESAVRSGEPGAIKSEAQDTIAVITRFLSVRGESHQAQLSEMAARLQGLRDELDSVRAQAAIDGLTQVYNRAAFDEQIEREVDLATLFGQRGCLIFVDLDHFKWVNDNHGHLAGDEVLRQMAQTLSRCFMRKDDFLARYGGEEFVVVLRELPIEVAAPLAERAMTSIRNAEIELPGVEEPLRITASMGLARLRPGEGAASWVERADRALYQAKEAGRDRVAIDTADREESTEGDDAAGR